MRLRSLVILGLILLFGIQSVSYAASISTRVRILESKVSKNVKELKRQSKENHQHAAQLQQGLKQMEEFRAQFEAFVEQQEAEAEEKKNKQDKSQLVDKRYAYP